MSCTDLKSGQQKVSAMARVISTLMILALGLGITYGQEPVAKRVVVIDKDLVAGIGIPRLKLKDHPTSI